MTKDIRRICAALALMIGAAIAAPGPLSAQEGAGPEELPTLAEKLPAEGPAAVETADIVGEDVQVSWGEDGSPRVQVAIPATIFMPIDAEELGEVHRTLQEELNRLGCEAGTVDGEWGRRSEQAMDRLRAAVPDIKEMELSLTLAGLVRKMPEGTCPLVCTVREVRVGDRCEPKTCGSGQYLDSRGECRVRQAKPTASKPARSSSAGSSRRSSGGGGGGRKCATYNGRTYCN